MKKLLRLLPAALALAVAAVSPSSPPPPPAQPSADEQFATLEHDYAVYMMSRFPVVATYLGGSAFDPSLSQIDGKLRDYSAEALQAEDVRLGGFADRFTALDAGKLSPRRRIDRCRGPGGDRVSVAPTPGAPPPGALTRLVRGRAFPRCRLADPGHDAYRSGHLRHGGRMAGSHCPHARGTRLSRHRGKATRGRDRRTQRAGLAGPGRIRPATAPRPMRSTSPRPCNRLPPPTSPRRNARRC